MKIVLDTNFLIDVIRFKIDLSELDDLLNQPYSLVTLNSVIEELEKIANKKTKAAFHARTALRLVRTNKIEVVRLASQTDKALLELAKSKNFIVATNDIKLRKELKTLNMKSIYLKSKKHLAVG